MYTRSYRSLSRGAMPGPERAWARPAIPGRTARRRENPGCARSMRAASSGRSGRGPHQAHLAAQYVHDLGQFVEVKAANHTSGGRAARVASARQHRPGTPLGARHHAAELQHAKDAPVAAQTRLAVQHRTAVLKTDRHGDRGPKRQPKRPQRQQHERRHRQVEGPLVALPAPGRADRGTASVARAHDRLRNRAGAQQRCAVRAGHGSGAGRPSSATSGSRRAVRRRSAPVHRCRERRTGPRRGDRSRAPPRRSGRT